ncbi:HalOD1 output domain-containing protein [Natronoglomus mannanivorans]|uniref:Halobacterial output domain-containing protein n=1 Tax=Natronoglomus mannanivorans TaxID=2979990 RepID=A0AAP3E2J2_9EURY|nr:hypothetical protein [Halobacteria archaeon AArc-xg1-1]
MCASKKESDTTSSHSVDGDDDSDPDTELVYATFDADPSEVVVTIVETVAVVTNRDPVDMPPLFDAVHVGALTDLVTSSREVVLEVTFSYGGCRVTVSSCGDVVVTVPG